MRRRKKGGSQSGQAATEYMLAIAVIVIAVVAAAWPFYPAFRSGTKQFGQKFETYFAKPGYGNTP